MPGSASASPYAGGWSPPTSAAAQQSPHGWQHVAWLPKEAVCTENLTPWLRLLPCRGWGGLASLLANRGAVLGGGEGAMVFDNREANLLLIHARERG
jgi:hypothetical protein